MTAALHAGSVPGMDDGVEVSALREEEFESLLPLIAAYQGFYKVDKIEDDRNRAFFRRFVAPSEEAVRAFHAGGVANGGTDNGEPGVRPDYSQFYYAAFVIDPDGYRLEAYFQRPE